MKHVELEKRTPFLDQVPPSKKMIAENRAAEDNFSNA